MQFVKSVVSLKADPIYNESPQAHRACDIAAAGSCPC
jgi:hypothetical protein